MDLFEKTTVRKEDAMRELLAVDSPARRLDEFAVLFAQLGTLDSEIKRTLVREELLRSVLSQLEEAEHVVADAEKQLNQSKATLAGYATELGKAAFDAFRLGEIPESAAFAERKELQSQIDQIQQRRNSLAAVPGDGLLEKAKVHAQSLALAGQLRLEEFKVAAADKAVGAALLASRNLAGVRCDATESLLQAIVKQNKQVVSHSKAVKEAKARLEKLSEEVGGVIGHSGAVAVEMMRDELAVTRKTLVKKSRALESVRAEVLQRAIGTSFLREALPSLKRLADGQTIAPELSDTLSQAKHRLAGVARKWAPGSLRRISYVAGGVVLLLAVLVGSRSIGQGKKQRDSSAASRGGNQASSEAMITARSSAGVRPETKMSPANPAPPRRDMNFVEEHMRGTISAAREYEATKDEAALAGKLDRLNRSTELGFLRLILEEAAKDGGRK